MLRKTSRSVGVLAALFALALAAPISAGALDNGATAEITDVKTSDGVVQFLFSARGLPAGSVLNPDSVVVDDNGVTLPATASIATSQTIKTGKAPLREAVVVLDTSGSMEGDGIQAARSAAIAYVEALPPDVRIGLVTFSEAPHVVQRPTTSRPAMRHAIGTVRAGGNTSLYDGVIAAVDVMDHAPAGASKRLLVLSDGDDTSSNQTLSAAIATAKAAGVAVDVVAFRLPGSHAVLQQLASSSNGKVLSAQSTSDVANAFTSAAAEFQSQVLVTAQVPAELAGKSAHLVVTMNSQDRSVIAGVDVKLPGSSAVQRGIGPLITKAQASSTSDVRMWLVLGTAFVVLLIAALFALWVPTEVRARSATQSRLAEVGKYRVLAVVSREQGAAPTQQQNESAVSKATLSFFDRLVRSGGKRQTIVERLERAGLRIRPEEWVVLQVAIVLVLAALVAILAGNLAGIFVGGLLGYFGCRAFLKFKTDRRSRAFNDALPDVLQLISGSLRSGFSLNQAVAAVVREGNEPVASEIARALTEVRLGSDLEDALDRVADRMNCADLHWVVIAVRISREVGGNLAEVLMNTVGTMRERAQIRGQIRVLSAEGRISARILISLPFLLAGYLVAFRPSYLRPLYTTGVGIGLVIGGVVLLGLGAFWISRLVKIEV
jgi:tight adherence protein B